MKKLSEGQRLAILAGARSYWREILLVLLILVVAGLAWLARSARAEADALKSRVDLSRTIAEEQAKLDEIQKREAELYPAIEKKLKELAEADAELAKRRAALDKQTRRTIETRIQKLTTDELAEAFKARGYPAKVIKEGVK
jgi:septal ring factor EnvC (AmiA/AmiB activator)